jgi:amino acid adenylation domain-containing protein
MNHDSPPESIAIVGMAGRFPKAKNLEEFWENLRNGVEAVSFFNDDQVQWLPIEHPPVLSDPRFVKARAVLDRPEWFDAAFFNMNPKEAAIMDPQHRVFLECAWEALEHAGCNPEAFPGLIGVFAGASMNTYLFTNLLTNRGLVENLGLFPAMIANDGDFVPTRVSYKFNLRGPSINVQTACSTSLVAVCLACQSLLGYRCDVALAGGVSITFPSHRGQHHLEGGIMSPDGHCRAFDARAAGTVLGDGAGVVTLKRLSDALADGDNIHAVIKGTAINNDGSGKIGYTAPSIDGQAEVIAMAQSDAGVDPGTISYIEAHGTGTPLGDPIEVAGLTKAFGGRAERGPFCAIGSVKSNIGHLDIGAGVAGLIKTVLALQHGELPPSLHFEQPNPKIDFAHSPFFVNTMLRPWPRGATPRRAGVSSFGIGGTNAHVVLEEAPTAAPVSPGRPPHLLLLSARTATALDAATENLAKHLERNPGVNPADVAFTLQAGRKVFPHRRALVCDSVADAVQALRSRDTARLATGRSDADAPPVAFMFPGQGSQAIDMARGLYETEPEFRATVDRCCAILRPRIGLDLRELMFPGRAGGNGIKENDTSDAARRLNETRLTQPALFVIGYALAQRWLSWGIQPRGMIGHSLGEYVAACVAGVFPPEDALTLVAERARLMQEQPPGAMLAVRLPESRLGEFLQSNLALAAVNAPDLCVVSGPFDVVDALEQRLAAGAIAFKRIATSHAFHSAMMDGALRPLAEIIRGFTLHPPKIPFVSNVTGTWITAAEAVSPEYWVAHLRRTVRFADGVGTLLDGGSRVLLEVGPGQTLTSLARQHPAVRSRGAAVVATLGRAGAGRPDRAELLRALGDLWIAGVNPDWRGGVYRDEKRRIVPLPAYPFERKRYWIEPGASVLALNGTVVAAGLAAVSEGPAADAAIAGADPTNEAADKRGRSTVDRLKAVFEELSGTALADAGPEASFYDLGFDSLFLTLASAEVARRFSVEVTFRQLRDELATFGRLAAYVESRSAEPSAKPSAESAAADPIPVEKPVPLTDTQREMWFASQLGTAVSAAYNEESTLRLTGPLDFDALRRALARLTARHEALRATFSPGGDVQHIRAAVDVELTVHDLSQEEEAARSARAAAVVDEHVQRPFDLVRGPVFRVALVRLEREVQVLVLVVHHIVCDGWSLGTIVGELGELYTAEAGGRAARLKPAPAFSEYAARAGAAQASAEFARAEKFWRGQFADGAPVLELPTDRPRPAARTYQAAFLLHTFSPEMTGALKRFCAARECTLFTALMSAFNVLLHRLSGQDDLVVGVPSAAQVMDGAGEVVGHFANLLAVRSQLQGSEPFGGYLARFRRQLSDALDHWRYPFGRLIQDLKMPRDATRMPLANVVFNSSRLRGTLQFGSLAVEPAVTPKRHAHFDLDFNFATTDETISLGCYYSNELFDRATIARWIGHLETLLGGIVAKPEAAIAELPLLTPAERHQIVVEWNATAAPYPKDERVHDRVFAVAAQRPDGAALVHGDATLSYGELARRADALARTLQGRGVGPDVPVGICLERSFDMVVAVLAVLRAGGAYVPLDPAYPAERLRFMLEDTRAPVLITSRAVEAGHAWLPPDLQIVYAAEAAVADSGAAPAPAAADPTDPLAYILYTSGSTGRPKGVAMPHRPLVNLITWQLRQSGTPPGARTLQLASLSFDVSFQEIFSTLGAGGTLVLVDEITRRDPRELWRLMAREHVERIFLPYVALQQLAGVFRPEDAGAVRLREVITAGEPLQVTPKIAAMFAAIGGGTLCNQYGPTEAHVVTALPLMGSPDAWPLRPSIGRPIANAEIFLLDAARQPVPIGVPGELCIGGDCLARGYLNRPGLTDEKFVPHPFRAGARIYRTGDRARYRLDGTIEFLGRTDHQVKVLGYRIEPGEVEAVLRQHAMVGECAVVVREEEGGNRRLVAYIVPAAGQSFVAAVLREQLQRTLPEYMIPGAFVALDAFPLTPSGKLDGRALPAPELPAGDAETGAAPPRTMVEELLAEIWCEVLAVPHVGIHANFFELGGHSLLAMQVITRVQESFGLELPLARFFATPTVAGLGGCLEELLGEEAPPGEEGPGALAGAAQPCFGP